MSNSRIMECVAAMLAYLVFVSAQSTDHDPLMVYSIEGKFHLLHPTISIGGDSYMYVFYPPSPNSRWYSVAGGTKIGKSNSLNEMEVGVAWTKDMLVSKAKTSVKNLTPGVNAKSEATTYGIGYKLSGYEAAPPNHTDRESKAFEGLRYLFRAEEGPELFSTANDDSTEAGVYFMSVIRVFLYPNNKGKIVIYTFLPSGLSTSSDVCSNDFDQDKEVLGDIDLNSLYAASKEADSSSFLIKQQLAPADNFACKKWKELTYHDLNTAPLRNVYANKWKSIDAEVRRVARWLYQPQIITGTLATDERDFLDAEKHIPVPNVFWTAIINCYVEPFEGMLIVMLNDPRELKLCEDVCEKYNWLGISDTKLDTGYAYCCKLNEEIREKLKIPEIQLKSKIVPLDLSAVTVKVPYRGSIGFINKLNIVSETAVVPA